MAKVYSLTDREGNPIAPVTDIKAVFNESGVDLDTLLAQQSQATDNKLQAYTKKTELSQGLAGKQDKLTTSEDLQVTDGSLLSLTEMAKKRLFIDMWNAACIIKISGRYSVGGYNADTGFFELNGLTDITYEQALEIYAISRRPIPNTGRSFTMSARTNLPYDTWYTTDAANSFYLNSTAEAVWLQYWVVPSNPRLAGAVAVINAYTLYEATKVKRVYGWCRFPNTNAIKCLQGCTSLETVYIALREAANIPTSIDISDCGKLSLDTFQTTVDQAKNVTGTVITVHPDVYAKLTGDTTNEAAAALTEEELAAWAQVVADAAAKNITFATV